MYPPGEGRLAGLAAEAGCWMEIITGVERRRRWRLEEKLRIVAEVEQLGASFAAVARRHEVSRGLLWNWRGQVRRSELVPEPMPVFLPMQITADPPVTVRVLATAPMEASRVETTLPNGTGIRVGADVGLAALACPILAACVGPKLSGSKDEMPTPAADARLSKPPSTLPLANWLARLADSAPTAKPLATAAAASTSPVRMPKPLPLAALCATS